MAVPLLLVRFSHFLCTTDSANPRKVVLSALVVDTEHISAVPDEGGWLRVQLASE